jgi:hypothetical protein
MPRKAPADDPYRDLPDSGTPHRTAAQDDDPYASMADTSDLESNAAREGVYAMRDAAGKKSKIPYSAIARASKAGYVMQPEDRERYLRDAAYDPKKGEGIDLPEGVVVVGRNTAGRAILAPAGPPQPKGGAARRFLSSAFNALVSPVTGAFHALADAPRTDEERAIAAEPWLERLGPAQLFLNRLIAQPMEHEAQRTAEEYAGTSTPGFTETPLERGVGTVVHALGTAVPLIGPAAAGIYEGAREKYAAGDYAGAAGSYVGNVGAYLAPEGLGALGKSKFVSRTIPHSMVTKMIRPMQADLKFGKNPARAILDEGITGNTLEDIGNKVSDRLGKAGRELDREAQKYPAKRVDVSGSLRPLDDAMVEAVKAGDRQLFAKLQAVRSELTQNWRPFRTARGRVVMRPVGPRNLNMSPFEAVTFKRQVGDRIAWSSDPFAGKINQALAGVYGEVKDATNNAVPGLKDLNTKYSDLVGAAQAIRRRLPVESRNAAWSLSDIVIGTHNIPLAITRHIARTPAFRSRAAVGLYNLPRVIPKYPALAAAPVTGAAASLQELQDEARRRNPVSAAQP